MSILGSLRSRSGLVRRRIVLPETADPRVLVAAKEASQFAEILLLGEREKLHRKIKELDLDLSGTSFLNPTKNEELTEELAGQLNTVRAKHFPSLEIARKKLNEDWLYYGNMLVAENYAHGQVGGSLATSAAVVRSALHCIGTERGLASSFMLMVKGDSSVVFADCGLVVDPNSQQLAEIAVSSAHSAKTVLGLQPKIALLSFSTKGSADHALVDKVRAAVEIARKIDPRLEIDGEMQFDAAYVSSVAERKAPESSVAGRANVFIFPDLNAGNIGYKIAQRMGGYEAVGPILQGFKRPSNDLSRGCSPTDIANAIAITALQVSATAPPLKPLKNIEML